MKPLHSLFLGMLLICGCASPSRHDLVLAPVAPDSDQHQHIDHQGKLVVYTELDVHAHFYGFAYHRYYSDYEIRTEPGALLKKVHNDSGTVAEGPVEVPLEAGKYQIRARANGYGWVLVPVIIESGKVTTVHLDDGSSIKKLSKA
jgi:hypothetical protein